MPRPKTYVAPATEKMLAWHVAKGRTREEAIRLAGFSSIGRAESYMRGKAFGLALREGIKTRFANELAPKAVSILESIMCDTKVSARVRVDAAKAVLDRAGYSIQDAAKPEKAMVDITNMTVDQLEALVSDLGKATEKMIHDRASNAIVISANGPVIDDEPDPDFADAMT